MDLTTTILADTNHNSWPGLWSRNSKFRLQASKFFGSGSRTIWFKKHCFVCIIRLPTDYPCGSGTQITGSGSTNCSWLYNPHCSEGLIRSSVMIRENLSVGWDGGGFTDLCLFYYYLWWLSTSPSMYRIVTLLPTNRCQAKILTYYCLSV